jgi:hypothetical protein
MTTVLQPSTKWDIGTSTARASEWTCQKLLAGTERLRIRIMLQDSIVLVYVIRRVAEFPRTKKRLFGSSGYLQIRFVLQYSAVLPLVTIMKLA